jgi:hypothetical protein
MVASFCGDFLSFPQKVARQKSLQNDDLLLSMKYPIHPDEFTTLAEAG